MSFPSSPCADRVSRGSPERLSHTAAGRTLARLALAVLLGSGLAAAVLSGCNDNQLGVKVKKPNRPPQTILSSGPPDSSTGTPYRVHLFWSGSDPDGTIDHYDYIMVDHPAYRDSIAGADTTRIVRVVIPAPEDPRWTQTTAKDSLFTTRADTLRVPPNSSPPEVIRQTNFERWHTFFVRSVDNEGLPDPTPDYRSFNSKTLAPTVTLTAPIQNNKEFTGPPVIVFNWAGQDPVGDGTIQDPVASRWVMIPTCIDPVASPRHLNYPDSLYTLMHGYHWSPWRRWNAPDKSGRRAVVHNLVTRDGRCTGFYIFAVQAIDDAGAVTPVFDFVSTAKNNVALVSVSGTVGPTLILDDKFMGTFTFLGNTRPASIDVAAGQEIQWHWRGDGASYGGEITDFRYGWDVRNPSNDQEWEQNWSITAKTAPKRIFASGSHRFFVEVRDNAESVTRAVIEVIVHQVTRQRDLLFVDDSVRESSPIEEKNEDNAWAAALDWVRQRHEFSYEPARDRYVVVPDHHGEPPPIGLIFDYKAVIWTLFAARGSSALRTLSLFVDPFVASNLNTVTAFNYLNTYLANRGEMWVSGFRPANHLWPVDVLAIPPDRKTPVNVTDWDDPITSHKGIADSVGTISFIYKMGLEAFDVGSGGASPIRFTPEHNCKGFRRGDPLGSDQQSFTSSTNRSHSHKVALLTADVDLSPLEGRTYETDRVQGHTHTITLTQANFQALQAGDHVTVTTSEGSIAGQEPHTHTMNLVDHVGFWGAPALVVNTARWNQTAQGRPNVEIYNMPGFMASQEPPLLGGHSLGLYTYVSGVPEDAAHGFFYRQTADRQPTFILGKGSAQDPFYTRAFCGFEPYLLTPESLRSLTEYVLIRHFRLGLPDAP